MRPVKILCVGILFLGLMATNSSDAASPAKEQYKIGVCLALTGPLAALGDPELKGAKLAVEVINEKGGVHGRLIELIIEDDAGKPELSVVKGSKLITKDEVLGIFGGTTGDACMAIASIAEKKKIPFISPTGFGGDEIQRGYKYNFLCIPDYDDAVEAIIKYAKAEFKCNRFGLLRLTRFWGVQASRAFHKFKNKYGIEVVREETCADGDKDFTPQLTNIKAAEPCAICIWASAPAAQIAIKNARHLGISVPLLGNVVFASKKTPEIAGEAAEGVIAAATMIWTDPLPRQQEYVERFTRKYGMPPDMWDAMGYDGIMLFTKAIGSLPEAKVNRENIRGALEKIPIYEGASAIFKYSQLRWPIAESWIMISIKEGKFYRIPFKW
ncbi:MAG: amino acid ABC transporter substrate-binding protein [Deltaproteobacteria bacterium]|nr:amino acid ABC transporter substrate-binding protein [Deltaproteobacteria bacterium]